MTGQDSFIIAETAQAHSNYGLLGVEGRGTVSTNQYEFNYFTGPIEGGSATAEFSDDFTISSSSAFSGFLVVSDAVNGFGYITGTGSYFTEPDNLNYNNASVVLEGFGGDGRGASTGWLRVTGPSPFETSLILPISGTKMLDGSYNDSGYLTEMLETGTYCQMLSLGQCDSFMNFLDTSRITGVSLIDANGNPLDASITFASGTNYNAILDDAPTGVTPEPSTLALLGTGLVGAAAAVRRRTLA